MGKVFCIGFGNTGTSTLHTALELLGYKSLHWGGHETGERVLEAKRQRLPLLTYIADYDAYSDIAPLTANFPLADEQYPKSHFILTTRDVESWLRSRQAHVEKLRQRATAGAYARPPTGLEPSRGDAYEVDPAACQREFEAHHQKVLDYFSGRDNLLIIDVTRGEGWYPLCRFLGHPIPDAAFPWRGAGRPSWDGARPVLEATYQLLGEAPSTTEEAVNELLDRSNGDERTKQALTLLAAYDLIRCPSTDQGFGPVQIRKTKKGKKELKEGNPRWR